MRPDPRTIAALLLVCAAAACSRTHAREYELRGQILAVDAARQEITIKHGDIEGFMPGMTMPFKVRDRTLLEGRTVGDLIKATLVVENSAGYLSAIERTGHAPVAEAPRPRAVEPLKPGESVPDVVLLDQNGKARRLSDCRGRLLAVTFTYTRCPLPDFCPLMDRNFLHLQQQLARDPALKTRVHLLTVSVDPDFDTPAVLAAHAKRLGANPDVWTFATGDRGNLDSLMERFGVSVIRDDPKPQEVVHNLRTAVVDTEGRLVEIFNGNDWKPADLLDVLKGAAGDR
jgi:protein SCO1/2